MAEQKKKLTPQQQIFAELKLKDLPHLERVYEIKSTATVTETCELLTKHNILSAPVRDVTKADDASWTEKYLGIVSMFDILLFALKAFEDSEQYFKKDLGDRGAFLPLLQSAKKFSQTSIKEILNDDRTPFMPISSDSSVLEAMWLMNKQNHIQRLIVVHPSENKLVNIITQSDIIKFIHDNLKKFPELSEKSLEDLKLIPHDHKVLSVRLTNTPIEAFKLIREHNVSAVPVIGSEGLIVANLSVKDARSVVKADDPLAFQLIKSPLSEYMPQVYKSKFDVTPHAVVCKSTDTLATAINKLVDNRIHRVWINNASLKVVGVLSLTDVIDLFVGNPEAAK